MIVSRRLAALLSVVFMVGACSSAGTATSTAPTESPSGTAATESAGTEGPGPEAGPVHLTMSGGWPELQVVYDAAAAAYHELHPNVTIDATTNGDLRAFEQKMAVALPTGTSTDIVIRDPSVMAPYITQGLVAPVPAWLGAFINSSAFDKATTELVTNAGTIYGIPLFLAKEAIFYNKDMFAAAGLQPPTTMDELWSHAAKLTKYDANGNVTVSGLSLRLSGQGSGVAEKFWCWLMQYSTPEVAEEFLTKTPAGKYHAAYATQTGAELLVRYVNMTNKKPYVDDPKIAHDAKAFETKATAMFMRESFVIGDIAANAPDLNYGTIQMPTTSYFDAETAYVATSSKHQQTAWDFLRTLDDLESQLSIAKASGWIPARLDLDYSTVTTLQPAWVAFLTPSYKVAYQPPPALDEWDEIETKLADHLVTTYADTSLVDNPAGALQRLQQFADETNAILKQHDHYGE